MAKILIVDDTEKDRMKYASLAAQAGHDIILASGVKEGIEKIVSEHPDAVVTDKDMPDGSGNDVAKYAKQNVPGIRVGIRVLGITGGVPEDFDEQFVDIRMSKSVVNRDYLEALEILLKSENPKEEYRKKTEQERDYAPDLSACYVLVQGFVLGTQVQNGVQPIPGLDIKLNPKVDPLSLLNFENVGLSANYLFRMMCSYDKSFRNDSVVKGFISKLDAQQYKDVTLDEALHVQSALYKLLGGE